MQKELVMKIVVGTASIAAIVTVIGVPVWGFSPLVIAAAALLAAVSVVRILFPDRR